MDGLRRRLPYQYDGEPMEEIPLLEAEEGAAAAVETAEGIEMTEMGAFATFASVEEAAAALDASGIAAPLGVAIGVLAAIGFGIYEIYEHAKTKDPNISIKKVQRKIDKFKNDPDKVTKALNAIKTHLEKNTPTEKAIILQESQGASFDFVPMGNSQLTLPFHKYTGPGNPLDSGDPVNEQDANSRIHDHAYNNAYSEAEIVEADEHYIEDTKNTLANVLSGKASIGNLPAVIAGGIGIGAKKAIESQTGVLYPSNVSGKKWVESLLIAIRHQLRFRN